MPSTEELVASILARLDSLERKPTGFDWSHITSYLPAVRSLVWMIAGAVSGGTIGSLALTPAPQVITKEVEVKVPFVVPGPATHTKEVIVPSNQVKSGEGPAKVDDKK